MVGYNVQELTYKSGWKWRGILGNIKWSAV